MNLKLGKNTNKCSVKKKKMTTSEKQLWSLCAIPIILVFIFNYLPMGGLVLAYLIKKEIMNLK